MAVTRTDEGPEKRPTAALWKCPGAADIWRAPLPHLGAFDRGLARGASTLLLSSFHSVRGLEHIAPEADPFILAVNHVSRLEALALPPLLIYHRLGKRVHFLADWNFQMIPGIGLLYRRAGAIVVTRKSARPRFLNILKPLFAHKVPSMVRGRTHLEAGRSLAIFPEGTVNRAPDRLLRGRLGAARLSLESGVAVVPAGIRVCGGSDTWPLLDLRIGPAMRPAYHGSGQVAGRDVTSADVREWHSAIMIEIARLSGKAWEPMLREPRHGTP